ncbi:MAG: HesA/MoeB/ThiF family protein [Deltaproteobacteria bacterium]|nr:HesA/MoeB/ThiF family protein [Deltaproteobacteria bacterium]
MSSVDNDQLNIQFKNRYEMIEDPAGRQVRILKDGAAFEIASACDVSIHDVYKGALREGITPYRYIRNRDAISSKEQLTLAESHVGVVGSGGLGGQVILLLARIGVGHFTVIDRDMFDETNLNRQALSSLESLGKYKSEEAVRVVASVNPGVRVTSFNTALDGTNAEDMLNGVDVIVDALDNVSGRFILEKAAGKLRVPLVHGALAGFEGQLMTIFPGDRGLTLLYGSEGSNSDRRKRPEAILGVPALTPAFIATLQAMEVVKIILKRSQLHRNAMVHVDLENGEINRFTFEEITDHTL